MKSVRISIVIPIYNAEGYLDKCLSSILRQDMHSFEVILVDDGSTDSSSLICERYSSTDPRFKTIVKANGGVSSARNAGMDVADGEYMMFVDSDDALAPGALSILSAATEGFPDFVLGGFNVYDDGIFYEASAPASASSYAAEEIGAFFTDTMTGSGKLFRGPWAKLYRTSVIRRNGLRFNESLCYAEDKLFIYEFLRHVSSAASINVPVYEYFRRSGTLSGGKTDERRASQLLDVLPPLSDALIHLMKAYPGNAAIEKVYHYDVVCHDLMRVLRYFMKRRTCLLTEENISMAYRVLSHDCLLRLWERKVPGQVVNVLLYRIGNISFSKSVFGLSSSILSIFHA